MGWFLRGAPWQVAVVLGLAMIGFAAYRLTGHHAGPGTWVLGVAGVFAVVRGLSRAGRGGSGS